MKNLLIGSRALNYWYSKHQIKPSTDWDVISDKPIEGTEWHDPSFLNNYKFEQFTHEADKVSFNGHTLYVVLLDGLSIIKRSHLWRDLSFDKHITMYHKYLVDGFYLTKYHFDLLKERTELTHKAFPQAGPNLNQSVKDFFDDAVTKKYNHDDLHEIYAYTDNPMYTKLQKDNSTVMCSSDMWYNFSHDQKLLCIAEECYVIATERFLVPNDWNYDSKRAYYAAVRKVCTTLCKGWFRDYAIDYYPNVLDLYDKGKFSLARPKIQQLPLYNSVS